MESKKTKFKKKKKKPSIAKKILVTILEEVLDCGNVTFPNICGDTYRHREYGGERHIKQEISRLKREKFIEERKRGNRLYLCLTEKGKKVALRLQILNCDNILKDKYYVVVFDIPETERRVRDFFRLFLKEAGFVQLQKSVWVTQKNVLESLTELIHEAKAEKWVSIITSTAISNFSFKQKM